MDTNIPQKRSYKNKNKTETDEEVIEVKEQKKRTYNKKKTAPPAELPASEEVEAPAELPASEEVEAPAELPASEDVEAPAELLPARTPMEHIKLIHGECIEEMAKLPAKSVDMILCDLPYGVTKNKWDTVIPFDKLWEQYSRIITDKGAIVLFGSQPFTSMLVMSNLDLFRYCLVWEKNKFSDFLNSKRKPMKTNEDICVFYKKQPVYNPQYTYSTPYKRWNTAKAVAKQSNYGKHGENIAESDGKRLPTTVLKFDRIERPQHPTQKPVPLLEWLIKTYSNEGQVILDNTMGVGSTGVAARNLGRHFIGIELEKKYFDIANERVSEGL